MVTEHAAGSNGTAKKRFDTFGTASADEKPLGLLLPDPEALNRERQRLSGATAAERINDKTFVDYLVTDILAAKQPMIIAGPSKSMKTSLALDLAVSLVTATPFLGRFEIDRSYRTQVFLGETGGPVVNSMLRATLNDKYQYEIRGSGSPFKKCLERLWVADGVPYVNQCESMHVFEAIIVKRELDVVIVDPAYFSLGGSDFRNLFSTGEQLRQLTETVARHGATLVLVHHVTKSAGRNRDIDLTDFSGAGFAEFARQWMLVNWRSAYDTSSTVRNHQLQLNVGGGAGHAGKYAVDVVEWEGKKRVWRPNVRLFSEVASAAAEKRNRSTVSKKRNSQDAALERLKTRVRAELKNVGSASKRQLRTKLNCGAPMIDKVIAAMEDELTKVGGTRGSFPCDLFSLRRAKR